MKRKIFIFIFLGIFFFPSFNYSQTEAVDDKNTSYIQFYCKVNYNSISYLISLVNQELKKGSKRFVILMSSPGGDVDAGISGYNYLKGIPAEVTTWNFGSIDSIALILFCAGEKRFAVPNARFSLHDISLDINKPTSFDIDKLDEYKKRIDIQRRTIAEIISKNSIKKISDIENAILETSVLDSEKAKEWGIINEIKERLFEAGVSIVEINEYVISKRISEIVGAKNNIK